MLLDESYFDTFPKEIEYNKYVLIEKMGVLGENFLGVFDSEIEAYYSYKKIKSKRGKIINANIVYVNIDGDIFIYKYEEIK